MRSWWRGTSIEAAFRKSHQAEAELAQLYEEHEVNAEAPAVSIRNLRGTATPFDVPIALAPLKVPAGVLRALGALIAIRGSSSLACPHSTRRSRSWATPSCSGTCTSC
jgi:hypothetical protein